MVAAPTATMMLAEKVSGYMADSLALLGLLADRWRMAAHAGAPGPADFAYWLAPRQVRDKHYASGTGVGDLARINSAAPVYVQPGKAPAAAPTSNGNDGRSMNACAQPIGPWSAPTLPSC